MFEWMWNALICFGPTFFYFGTLYFFKFLRIFENFFPVVWAFHIYSCLSGCGCPNFFLVRHFSILGICIFSNFWGYLRTFSSSCLGISRLLMFEWMWNTLLFFFVRHFSILGLCIFSNFWGYLRLFLPAVYAFHVYPCFSGCRLP